MRHDSQHGLTSLTRLLAVVATLLLAALPAEPASFAYARFGQIVSVIDTANPSIVARIPSGQSVEGGGGLAVDPSGTRVYQVNFLENTVDVVDTASRTVIGTIAVSHPASVLMHPSGRVAYVSSGATVDGVEAGFLAVIETATNTVTAPIPMGPGFFVRSMVLHPAGTKLYVHGANSPGGPGGKVVVIDTSANAVAATVTVVGLAALAAHPAGTFVYIINADGVSVVDTSTDTVVATIPASQLLPSPQKMVVHPNGTFLYVIAGINRTFSTPSGNVAVVDTRTNRVVATIPLPSLIPMAAALIPSGTRLYVAGDVPVSCTRPLDCILFRVKAAGTAVIDTTTNTVMTIVPPGLFAISAASTVTVDPSGHSVYANNGGLTVIDASTNAVTATLPPVVPQLTVRPITNP